MNYGENIKFVIKNTKIRKLVLKWESRTAHLQVILNTPLIANPSQGFSTVLLFFWHSIVLFTFSSRDVKFMLQNFHYMVIYFLLSAYMILYHYIQIKWWQNSSGSWSLLIDANCFFSTKSITIKWMQMYQ